MRVVSRTADQAGLGDLVPHDQHRTYITDGLNSGATVVDMLAHATTTLRYAQPAEAKSRRLRIAF